MASTFIQLSMVFMGFVALYEIVNCVCDYVEYKSHLQNRSEDDEYN